MLRQFADAEEMAARLRPEVPVYCLRPALFRRAAERFLGRFPGRVLYAVKANPQGEVLDLLYAAGIRHFDTASLGEIALVSGRFPEATSYFMHPVKGEAAIRDAYQVHGVRHFVVDHADELDKIVRVLGGAPPDLAVMVRLATPGPGALFDLSGKFGAGPGPAAALLRAVADAGCQAGLCFHVGSQCTEPTAYRRALELSGKVVASAGVALAWLDVGGGFPSAYDAPVPALESFLRAIDEGLGRLGPPSDCVVMCEPGRALVAEAVSVVAQVQHRRDQALYLNDGIYGSLSGTKIGTVYPVRLLRPSGPAAAQTAAFTIYGPTCDGLDVLGYPFVLPRDARPGDWIEVGMLGAYASALRTDFNGFRPERVVAVADDGPAALAAPSGLEAAG
jgi:ornithine decarboxylase